MSDLFELYEPRPEYSRAVRLTSGNLRVVAEEINRNRAYSRNKGMVALVHPMSDSGYDLLLLHEIREGGELGAEVGRAYPHEHYVVETDAGYEIVGTGEFRRAHRKCVGEQWG